MALPSQMERSSELGRPYTARGNGAGVKVPRKQTLILAAIAGGLAVVVAAVWGVSRILGPSAPTGGAKTPLIAGLGGEPDKKAATQGGTPSGATPLPGAGSGPATPTRPTPATEGLGAVPQPAPAGGAAPGVVPSSETGRPTPVDVTNPGASPAAGTPQGGGSEAGPGGATPAAGMPSIPTPGSPSEVRQWMDDGDRLVTANRLVEARTILSRALLHKEAGQSDRDAIRAKLTTLNEDLVFSPKVLAGDPLSESYTVQSGDKIVSIAKKRQLSIDWRLITRINKVDPGKLRVGQKLKLVRGPFHAIVDKSDHRCDIFAGSPDDPDNWLYIRSFRVGLGTNDGTPVGTFVVKKGSKLINPPWVNPQTGQKFAADDPKNPIGEHWIGIEGLGASAAYAGFGLHGTIEPDSIGQQRSMGCVRMLADDIAVVYELLVDQVSVIRIVP